MPMEASSGRIRLFTNERGSALVATTMLVFLMTVLGIALYEAGVIESGQVFYSENELKAAYAAEAGLNRVVLDLSNDNVGCLNGSITNGALPSTATCPAWSALTSTPADVPGYVKKPLGNSSSYYIQARTD